MIGVDIHHLIGQEFETIAISFGGGKVLQVGVVDLVLELDNSRVFIIVKHSCNMVHTLFG